MKESIVKGLNRLSLHDSNIENIYFQASDLILELDWCSLDHYLEKYIEDGIVIGKSILRIKNFRNQEISINYSGTPAHYNRNPDYLSFEDFNATAFEPIGTNTIDEKNKTAVISGMYTYESRFGWLDWSFTYDSIMLEWNNFITYQEWRNGKVPN